ncbi:MAG: IS110 family transposase, partial [Alphaproteobacteria bacterium]|nr:IS110 family transposase [Alphaproteobacteria bacterium]
MGILTIGIDISKQKFDVCLENQDQKQTHKTFMNTDASFKKLGALLEGHQVTACLEATGVYGENLCQFLYDQGVRVFLINPVQIKYYAKSMMKRSKTDKIDAAVILQFIKLRSNTLKAWQPRSQEYTQLQSLFRCLKTFKLDRISVQGCIEACVSTKRA